VQRQVKDMTDKWTRCWRRCHK